MDLLNKSINTFKFDDIVAFCQEGHREGIQLDYKRDLPKDGLAKFFAAFSNTRGGIIIVGVDEDKKTGIPQAWDGVDNDAKLVERIHQYASNVEPIPQYEVWVTDEKNGKAFILVRIFEGDRTPYYVQNDANLWVRTGNISSPVDIASPDTVELLFGKKEKARLARQNYLQRTQDVFEGALRRADRLRISLIAQAEREEKGSGSRKYCQEILGSRASMCTVAVQPFYPRQALIDLKELWSSVDKIVVIDSYSRRVFPSLGRESEPTPDGILRFEWDRVTGRILGDQVFATGLLCRAEDILEEKNGSRYIYIYHIATNLMMVLLSARKYYQQIGYQGGIEGHLVLENVENVCFYPITRQGNSLSPFFKLSVSLLPKYEWEIELYTALLNDRLAFQDFYLNKVREIYWSLGYADVSDEILKDFLKQAGWLVE